MWGLPFLERVTEWRECAADGKRLKMLWHVRGVPGTRDVVPERECRLDRPKIPLCCTLLENIFRNVTEDASEWARGF